MKRLKSISVGGLWRSLVGREVGREDWIESQSRARKLREQSADISARLARCGLDLADHSRDLAFVGLCSGQVEKKAVTYRNSNLIPEVQARNVHGMLRQLQCYIDQNNPKQMRMLVISHGWQDLFDYNRAHRDAGRRVSKFFASDQVKAWGIEPLYFNIENTIHRDERGAARVNLHTHALLRFTRYLGKEEWGRFLAYARNYFRKGYVHDSPLGRAAECVKYVFKPSEFEQLADWELAVLAVQCHRMKFFHPVGRFRDWRRSLKDERVKVKKVAIGDKWEWRKVPMAERLGDVRGGLPPAAGRVVAMLAPAPRFAARLEPVLAVQGYAGDLAELVRQNGLQGLADDARALWGRALSSIRDTTTTTVRRKSDWPPGRAPRREGEAPCHAN